MDVEETELLRELDELNAFGVGGVEIQPLLFGVSDQIRQEREKYLHRYLTDFHFDILSKVLDKASRLDMFVDYTICSSWPPGGSHIDHEKNMQILIMGTDLINIKDKNTDSESAIKLPEMNLPPYYSKPKLVSGMVGFVQSEFRFDLFKPVAACACKPLKKDGKPNYILPKARPLDFDSIIDLTDYIDHESSQINYQLPEGKWRLFVFYGGPSCMTPMNYVTDEPNKLSLTLDHLDKSVIQFHLSKILPEIGSITKHYGKTLRSIFTDSQELAAEWFWTHKFFKYFESKRGYDIRKYLPACLVPNHDNQFFYVFFQNETPCYDFPNGIGQRLRYDYWLTVSDLFCEEFTKGISEWLNPKKLQNRIQAYGIHADLLKCYGRADIPETEQLYAGGLLDFQKIAGSAAIIYGKKEASCESFTWADREYLTTPLKWKVAADRLFISGINRMVYHGYPYFAEWQTFPGYFPFNPPNFSENLNRNNTFAPYFPIMNGYVTRGQYLMQEGITDVDIGLFYPHLNYNYKQIHEEDLAGGYLEGFDSIPLKGPINWFKRKERTETDRIISKQQDLAQIMTDNAYYYTHINEESIINGEIKGGALIVGYARLKCLIFQDIDNISVELAKRLSELVQNNVHLIFIESVPNRQSGFFNWEENDKIICDVFNDIKSNANFHFIKSKKVIADTLKNGCNIEPFVKLNSPVPRFGYIKKKFNDGTLYFMRNGLPKSKQIEFSLNEQGMYPYKVDLFTGKTEPFESFETDNESLKLTYKFSAYESIALLLNNKPHSKPVESKDPGLISNKSILIENWTITCDGTVLKMKNLKDLKKTELKYNSGPIEYTAEFNVGSDQLNHSQYLIEFTKIFDVAEVTVNGMQIGTLFCPPYVVSIPKSIIKETNILSVKVTGCLRNLLIGMGQKGVERWRGYRKKPIQSLGLVGNVYFIF